MFGRKSQGHNPSFRVARSVPFVQSGNGAPAVDLARVQTSGVDLTKRYQKAGISLSKRNLAGVRAQAVLILDHSGSMRHDYADGTVQQLVERVLGFALQVDADGTIPVLAFDTVVHPTVDVRLDNYAGVVDREVWRQKAMGTTDLAAALKKVRAMAERTDAPLFCIVITDGSPNSKPAATKLVCELAGYPVFLKFLAVRPVDYLDDLDDLPDTERLLDNVDAKHIGDPTAMSDLQFADAMADEWDSWITLARSAGVLT